MNRSWYVFLHAWGMTCHVEIQGKLKTGESTWLVRLWYHMPIYQIAKIKSTPTIYYFEVRYIPHLPTQLCIDFSFFLSFSKKAVWPYDPFTPLFSIIPWLSLRGFLFFWLGLILMLMFVEGPISTVKWVM